MARSVRAALRGRAVDPKTADRVVAALGLAMGPRQASLDDDHHPGFLHPGRSVLVLLHDVESLEPGALSLAALHESVDEGLRVPPARIAQGVGSGDTTAWLALAEEVAALPRPADARLAERLVLLPRASALAVLAEWLDHLRHLHLRPELRPRWRAVHDEVDAVWGPFAGRVDERLAVRFGHWSRTFARRLRRDADQLPRV